MKAKKRKYCAHREPLESGWCPDCEQDVSIRMPVEKRKSYSERTCLMACRRVLRLVDGYLAKQPQDTLTTDGKGLMTWGGIRQHIKGALRLARRAK